MVKAAGCDSAIRRFKSGHSPLLIEKYLSIYKILLLIKINLSHVIEDQNYEFLDDFTPLMANVDNFYAFPNIQVGESIYFRSPKIPHFAADMNSNREESARKVLVVDVYAPITANED